MSFFLDTSEETVLAMERDRNCEVRQITAYVSVYHVTKQFGGHEEGGWWYDDYEWLKVSVPFRAIQHYRFEEVLEEEMDPMFIEACSAQHEWKPIGPPLPADFPSQVRLDSIYMQLMEIYGEETSTRASVLSDGDIEFVIERNPGERGERPRPRYE